ncbi:Uu.00g002500.m01.CDS01 [Anthostomella pinea]|uniref:Uu.00g002500.m01.CDS01 n=1 Tax=Anthostomella pinea TaxID=933095 RepID=A0AAI8YIL5_9PEZI|nr:Uu.00g002500.m01.CDS01 [Anthostomella pinea]
MAANSARGLSCLFPGAGGADGVQRRPLSLRIELQHAELVHRLSAKPDGNVELATAVQTAFAVLLRAYTGLESVCFGLQETGGKHHDAVENTNPAVVVDVDEEMSYEQLIQHISTGSTMKPSNKETVDYNTAILFCFSNAAATPSLKPATMVDLCNLRLLVKVLKSGVSMFLEYRNSFIPTGQARNVASTVDKILTCILLNPAERIRDSDILSERNKLQIEKWNSLPLERVERTVHSIILETAEKVPQEQAVCSWDGQFTYRELEEYATKVAVCLVELGVDAEVIVPLCFEKSKWNVVATLGTLIAGGCFIPLDPSAPKDRNQYLLDTVNARVVVCSLNYAETFKGTVAHVVVVDPAFIAAHHQPAQRPQGRAESHNAAYIISTSGTTGQPKLPLIEHGNICTSVKAHYYGISMHVTRPLRVLQFSAHSFDVSISEILSTLMCGGTICIPDEYTRLNNIAQAMNDMRVTHAQLTPTFARFLEPSMVPTLATIVLMGEAMSQADLETWSQINLLNGWGPCETSVYCTTQKGLTAASDVRNIGPPFQRYDADERAVAYAWVVNPNNRHQRVPIGCTGEILLEGNIVGRGYFGDEEKTAQSFVTDVAWARNRPFRGYLSGDLVIQQPDGTYNIVGRKDNQVKYHGQRIELLGIEHHINLDPSIGHNLVFLPKSGLCKERLVAVVSLKEHTCEDKPLMLFEGAEKDAIYAETELIRAHLAERLPANMVPTVWVAISAFPRLSSRKLDRKQVLTWLTDMPAEVYQRAIAGVEEVIGSAEESLSEMEASLRSAWAHVLNLSEQQVALERPFLSLGGDSISAMQVMGHCRKKGVTLGVQDILRSRSIRQLATTARFSATSVRDTKEEIEKPFDLTPIQRYWFRLQEQGHGHFNQSFYLQVMHRTSAHAFHSAIEQLVSRHSMLRARFSFSDEHGWGQRVTEDIDNSYRFRNIKVLSPETDCLTSKVETDTMIEDSQKCLDYVHGPLFAADLFEVGGQQHAFLTIHHLVVDLVSWRLILEELEDILKGETLLPPALPFQKWTQLQTKHTRTLSLDDVLPLVDVPALDWSYWAIEHHENTYGAARNTSFSLDPSLTAPFLGSCHMALKTEPVEVLLASLFQAWSRVFIDRPIPAVFNEGHGREPWSPDIDISRTVGWFTTMNPVLVEPSDDLATTVRKVKDFRRQIPGKGRPYFARRWLTDDGQQHFSTHWPAEITFNYLGQYQQLERSGALLQAMENMAGETREAGGTADVGHDAPRISLFEVSAIVFKGCIKLAFTFNKNMQHQDKIQRWISECRQSITELIQTLPNLTPHPTLSDFPLLSLTEDRFQSMLQRLSHLGISPSVIEDSYPCSSMQEALLLSQSKDSATYACATLHELKLPNGRPQWKQLIEAWKQVVKYHPILRTIFLENVGVEERLYDQVVLRQVDANIVHFDCIDEPDALDRIGKQRSVNYDNGWCPAHRFTVCGTADGRVFCSLEISHAISDGHSMSLVFRNLRDAYMETLRDDGPTYSDYISYVMNQPKEASLDYWRSYLVDSETCDFPMLNDGQVVEAKDLVSIRLDFGNVSIRDLHSFCNTNGITLSNVIHTAWALTLSNYVGTKNVTFGYLTTARDSQDIHRVQDMFGPVINTLVYRVDLSDGSCCLLDVLRDVQQDYLNAIPHRHIALAEVQHMLGLSGANLFNTVLSYRRLPPAAPLNDTDIRFVELAPIYDPTEYPVSLNIEISDDAAAVDLDYWTDHLTAGQAANVASTFVRAIENIVFNARQSLSSLDHLSRKQLQQIQQWNVMPETLHDCVHHRFQSWVTCQPDAPAVRGFDGDYTYAELNAATDRLAHYLVELGVGPEVFVPTCFDKSSFAVVAMLAVLKAGGAAVPLDANHPKPALVSRVEDTQAQMVLTTSARSEMFEDVVPDVVIVDSVLINDLPDVDGPPCTVVAPHNPAFVIFTSGSTGRPKGVILEHAAIVTSANAHGANLGFGPGTRVLQFASYTFDNSLEEMFTTLQRGGCCCVPSEEQRMNDLAGSIAELDANFMDLTPTVASFLNPKDVPSIKSMGLGGEALTKAVIEKWSPHVHLHGQYGPSEASINSAWKDFEHGGEPTNIGRAIGSVSWIVDPDDRNRLVPIGCRGELLIEGPILSRGYLNDPEKTNLAFISAPMWARTDDVSANERRFYCTGDLMHYTSQGEMMYLGRKDSQVKLNGQRIELGEIEHHLKLSLPGDAQSAVELVNFTDVKATKALVGFLCLATGSSDASTAIGKMTESVRNMAKTLEVELAIALPAYYVPSVFMPVTSMPMTTSGKLDRKTLRQLAQAVPEEQLQGYRLAGKSGRAPSGHAEVALARLWAVILGLSEEAIGAEDSFFRLGGDSIRAMRLVGTSRKEGLVLSVASIFSQPKLVNMAQSAVVLSSDQHNDEPEPDTAPFELIPADDRRRIIEFAASECGVFADALEDIYPCTRLQEGLIALSTKEPGSYVAQVIYRLPPNTDIYRFKQAWDRVIAAEAILRTRIIYVEDRGFLQVVVRDGVEWHHLADLQDISETHRHLPASPGDVLATYAVVGEDTSSPFFVWTAHHAVYDGYSMPNILSKVEAAYRLPSEAPVAAVPYSRIIKYLSSVDEKQSDAFWLSKFENISAPQFPQLPSPDYKVQASSQLIHQIPFARRSGMETTLPSMIRAAWGFMLATYSASDDVLWGEINSGREVPVPGIEDIAGPTITTSPTRVKLDRQLTISAYMQQVQRQFSAVLPFQFAGLQHIRKLSNDTALACDFQSLLAIAAGDSMKDPDGGLWDLQSTGSVGTNFFNYALIFNCMVEKDSIHVEAHYDSHVIETWLVERLLQQFAFLLNRFNSPDFSECTLGDFELLNPKDHAVIASWNDKPVHTTNHCIQDVSNPPNTLNHDRLPGVTLAIIFEYQVILRPSATAIEAWDVGTLTYHELDQQATRLASRLISLGVKPRAFVPLFFDKSGFTIIAILAVLKCGAAFVPLDFEAPILRIREIVTDVNANLILCAGQYESVCRSIPCDTLVVDALTDRPEGRPHRLPEVQCDTPAYVLFTSGSTGKPKGAIINHNSFVSASAAYAPAWNITEKSRVLQFASYAFDCSLIEILSVLMQGGVCCVPDQKERTNDLVGVINRMRINYAALTPSLVRTLQPSEVPGLKDLTLVGEAMSQQDLNTWADRVSLGNGYGPTECSVVATFNNMTSTTKPNNIGKIITARGWVVAKDNHDVLVPLGAVGELLMEGGGVGAGYLHNPKKTAQAFISDVKWTVGADSLGEGETRRFYKTGDLVKYNEDSTLLYLGRKDDQTKVRGQRLELAEVEHHVVSDPAVQNVLAAVPTSGPCAKRLVGVISLQSMPSSEASEELRLLPNDIASLNVAYIRDRLCDRVPSYMVPSLWVVVGRFPLMPSGKMDRKRVVQFLERMGSDTYRTISTLGLEEAKDQADSVERRLQAIFAKVLNLASEDIRLNQSFLHLGGDSISAMQITSICRSNGFYISVQDIIRAKSITALASIVSVAGADHAPAHTVPDYNLPFDLTPIQRVFFDAVGEGYNHFNQSAVLRLARAFKYEEIKTALSSLVTIHPMLRARYNKSESRIWKQMIEKDTTASFRLRQHRVSTANEPTMRPIIDESQATLDITSGPTFSADLFEIDDTFSQAIAFVAHHLIIDVVSWGIILEDLTSLLSGTTPPPQSLPFHAWGEQQAVQARKDTAKRVYPLRNVLPPDIAYWGMPDGLQNINGDVITEEFELSPKDSMLLLGAHDALATEPLDVFLAAILESFRKVFPDRNCATVHNEGHGRESFDAKQDLSRTVGWFTTLTPIHLPVSSEDSTDIASTIRWVKDLRERIPGKGRPYFAYRLSGEASQEFSSHWPAEVTFNYLGRMQALERKDALLQRLDGVNTSDIGDDVPRLALFEITAVVAQGTINLSFCYNRHMKRQTEIKQWIGECRQTLVDAVDRLLQARPEPSLSDFNLLPLSYNGLSKLSAVLPSGNNVADIEDIYPTSPMQQGLLLSQMRSPELYAYRCSFEVCAAEPGSSVNPRKLAEAWQNVVHRHPALRTAFIESLSERGRMDQIVFKERSGQVVWMADCDGEDMARFLREQPAIDYREFGAPHRFTVCKTKAGRVWVQLDMSHTICDGGSIPNLLNDLSRAYGGKLSRSDAGPLFSEFIAHILSSSRESDINYWKTFLQGAEPCILPALNDGKPGAREAVSFEAHIAETASIRAFCKANGVTLSNVLQLTWALVLHYYVGTSDISFGVVASGRDIPVKNIEEAVGCLVNMLIYRLNFSDETPVHQLLASVQNNSMNARDYQGSSLADVQHELQLPSLFNTVFTFQRRHISRGSEDTALLFENIEAADPSEYDLTLNVSDESPAGITIDFGYWRDKMCDAQVHNLADTFEKILINLTSIADSKATVGDMDILPMGSLEQIRVWNANLPPPVRRCVHDIVSEQALLRPPFAKAVEGWDGTFTYQEFDAITNSLAIHLQTLGVGTGTFVPVLFEKSSWAIMSMLAIMKAGAVYVPLDPRHPPTRLRQLVCDVGAKVVVCSRSHQSLASQVATTAFTVDKRAMESIPTRGQRPKSDVTPDHGCYCLFTSGTTGTPKGTIVSHQAFCTSAAAFTPVLHMDSTTRTFQFASYTFDASCVEILAALTVGGTVCVPTEDERMSDLCGSISRFGATWALLTPSVLGSIKPEWVPGLKTLVVGGEATTPSVLTAWASKICFVEAYGPTETAIICATCAKSTLEKKVVDADPGTIGMATGCRTWVVHPRNHDKLMPVGGIGELVAEGHIVAAGYLGDEVKTAKAFIEKPAWASALSSIDNTFSTVRMYKTGDLVRYNSDGSLTYVSRKDTQIKLNGQRIELGEIEFHVKSSFPEGVQSAVELVAPMGRSAKALAVFFCAEGLQRGVPADALLPTSTDLPAADDVLLMDSLLRDMCKAMENAVAGVLPSYMIPSIFIPVSKMPWTAAGKLDRNRLKNLVQNMNKEAISTYRLSSASNMRKPTNETEKKLQKLVCSVLNLPLSSVGVDDSFVRLGGDSIGAMKLVTAAHADHLDLSVVDIFKTPRLSDLAAKCGAVDEKIDVNIEPFDLLPRALSRSQVLNELAEQCRVSKDQIQDAYPTSPLQGAFVTLSTRQPGAYVAQHVLTLAKSVGITKFKAAWQKVVADLDILRTRIAQPRSGNFVQTVLVADPITWGEVDSLKQAEKEVTRISQDLGGKLAAYTLVRTASHECYFVWTLHHSLYDGWSLPLILDRVQRIYRTGVSEVPKTPYTRFINYLQESDIVASAKYWKRTLGGAAPYHFPQPSHSALSEERHDGKLLHHTMKLAPHKHADITPSTVIRAAWSLLLAAYSGSDDVVFGETLTGRDIAVAGIADICGPTLTTVPSRVYIDRENTTLELLEVVAGAATDRIPHQHFGLSEIKRLDSDTAAACDFQNLLVIQIGTEPPSESLWSFHDDGTQANFFTYPLVVEATAKRTSVEVCAHFESNVISAWEVQRILFQLESVIHQLNTVSNVRDIHVFSNQDAELVRNWNAREPIVADETIHALFFEQVKARPTATAVSAFDGEFTYAELRELSSRLAQKLVGLGAGPERLVPLCVDKSRWAIVAIMGILISGSGFVPLSPQHPASRHQHIIESCSASIIVCSPEYETRFNGLDIVRADEKTIRQLPVSRSRIQSRLKSNNIAYVMFTSGSTGLPKGVVMEHRAFVASSMAMRRALNMDSPSTRVFQFASFVFDVSMLEILTTLTCGAVVAVPSEQERTSDLAGAINRLKATWACLTPSVANVLEGPTAVPTLKTFVSAAEALTTETIDKWATGLQLMNAYGPTENSVLSVVNSNVSTERDPTVIGHPLESARAWLTEADNPHRLAPVGAVAELCIEGPLLARCYLNDPAKTAEVFIENPAFMKDFSSKPHTRIYRTGDLCKYASDGAVKYLGRKDNQIKLAGQRVELGEIEHHLQADESVNLAAILMPKTGPGKRKLTAVVSFHGSSGPSVAIQQRWNTALTHLDTLRQINAAKGRLSDLLPPYMVPTVWVAVPSIPRLASAKLDKTTVDGWIGNMDDETYRQILNVESWIETAVPASEGLQKLQKICAKVLHVSVQDVQAHQSWVSLGGDSLIGMHFLAQCRKEGISITLNQLLRAKSLAQLAETALPATGFEHGEAQTEKPFGLSPVQQLYFQNIEDETATHFNQSFTLRLAHQVDTGAIRNAIDAVVRCHGMLRARFLKGARGQWQQLVRGGLEGTYKFDVHEVAITSGIIDIIANTQKSLNIFEGPVFATDLFNLGTGEQVLFITAHHLVIDVVSWQIILADLEEHIVSESSLTQELPFQVWVEKQAAHAIQPNQIELMEKQTMSFEPADLTFWGMENRINLYGNVEHESFTVGEDISAMALDNHSVLRTDVVDYFISAIIHSFSRVFVSRTTPTVFVESHGREPWDSTDLSRSVGWFTSMYPAHVPIAEDEDDVIQTVRQVKDLRRSVIENGRSYFAHRFMADNGKQRFESHEPMEVLFNYLGRGANDSIDSLFQPMQFSEDEEAPMSDLGAAAKRLALFEISATVSHGKIKFDFLYNQNQKNRKGIRRWIAECQRTLEEVVTSLAKVDKPQPTLSDFPLLPLESYARLDRVVNTFPSAGIVSYDQVEDMYPCSAMQEGMLLSQIKDPSAYWSFAVFEVKSKHDSVDVRRVAKAWKNVVARHPALRTVFVDSVCKGGVFDQIVVKEPDAGLLIYSADEADLSSKLDSVKYADHNGKRKPRLPHQFTIFQVSSGKVVVKLEINHSVIDGGSWAIIARDLQDAYAGRLSADGPLYSSYVKYLRNLPADAAIEYWREHLHGVKPCYLPIVPQNGTKQRQLHSLFMDFNRFPEVQSLAGKSGVTFANILLATWALILRSYTSDADVCFGYLTSGRNVPIENVENAVGAFINMLCSRIKVSQSQSLLDVFYKVQNDFVDSLPHQHCSLAQFQHDLGLSGKALFNTVISVQNYGATAAGEHVPSDGRIEFEHLDAHDPSEFAVTVSIDATRGDEAVKFAYWTDVISDDEARNISNMMAKILTQAIADVTMTITELDVAIRRPDKPAKQATDSAMLTPIRGHTPRPTYRRTRTGPEPSRRSIYSTRETGPLQVMTLPGATPDWSSLIRSIVSEMVPQIVDQVLAKNKDAPPPAQSSVDEMSSQMTSMLARRASLSKRGRPGLDRKISMASDTESRIGIAADMVAAAGVIATEALKGVPSDFVEKKLMTLWGKLLDMVEESIEKNDSFFQLGGDSIIAMRLVGAAREEGLSMTVADVFKNPTFADMARVVRVAGEVIDQVMSQTGDGGSVTGRPGSSKIQPPEHTASVWKDIEPIASEHAILDDTIDGGIRPPTGPGGGKRPYIRKWRRLLVLRHSIDGPANRTKAKSQSETLGSDDHPRRVFHAHAKVFKGGISDVLPVTDFQSLAITGTLLESRWMLNHFYLDGHGPLDIRRLKQAAFRVVQAFDILRTVFVPYGDRFLQVVLRKLQPDFIYQETDLDIGEFTTELRRKDREHGPRLGEAFVQFVVAKQKKTGQYRIHMRLSHAQYDGVCLPRMLESLEAGYNGLPVSKGPSFGNYVRETATARTVAGAHDHWREILRGSVMTPIVDRYGPNYQRAAGQTVTLKQMLTAPTLSHVNITTATVVKAAWTATLARIANKSDIVFGHVISGRNSTPSASAIVGPCLNMVPVRIVYRPGWTVLDLLGNIQDQQITNMPYESLGFREIIRNCTDWPDWTNFSSVLQHNQSIIHSDDATFKFGGTEFRLGVVGTEEDFADFSIVSISHGSDQVEVTLTYAPNSTITTEFSQHVFNMLCTNVIAFSEDPYAQLPSPSELSTGPFTTNTASEADGRKKSGENVPLLLPSDTGLSMSEITKLATQLRFAWSQILRPNSTGTPVHVDLDTHFFESGGDIMGLAQVASILDQEGLRVRVEDLLSTPLFVGQVGLLAEERKRVIARERMSPWGEKGARKEKEEKEGGERAGREAKLGRVESGFGKVLGKFGFRMRDRVKQAKA